MIVACAVTLFRTSLLSRIDVSHPRLWGQRCSVSQRFHRGFCGLCPFRLNPERQFLTYSGEVFRLL